MIKHKHDYWACDPTQAHDQASMPAVYDGESLSSDPVITAALDGLALNTHLSRRTSKRAIVRRPSSIASSTCASSRGGSFCASSHGHRSLQARIVKNDEAEQLLPYVPKEYELYALCAIPLIPFLLVILMLGPLLMEL